MPIRIEGALFLSVLLLVGLGWSPASGQSFDVESPDGDLVTTVDAGGSQLSYTISRRGRTLVERSPISMTLGDTPVLGARPEVEDSSRRRVDRILRPVVPEKNAEIRDRFRELRLDFEKDFALIIRAYNEGAAYRFRTQRGDSITVRSEKATFDLATGESLGTDSLSFYWARGEDSFVTHSESIYQPPLPPDSIAGRMSTAPLVATYGAEGPRVAITEVGLREYAGMYLVGDTTSGGRVPPLRGSFPQVALAEAVEGGDERDTYPTHRADYIARTAGSRDFPWRTVIVTESDAELLENQLVYLLAPQLRLDDPSWIDLGKVPWDWYNARNLFDVDFDAGVNTQTYKDYIDFAAEHGLEYVILDEGWYELGNLLQVSESIDMDELTAYAADRDVELILWVVWKTLDRQMEAALDQFEEWGIGGIKVDFMQRDDQEVVNFYWRTAREAADRELLVDFHGSYKPTGLRRAYPNVLTREGVLGLEHTKWSDQVTPEHNLTLPFTRMVAGPMDYTPGAMVNAQPQNFSARFERPISQGTRAHQLAMYVVYESPLQMLADSPSKYREDAGAMEFLADVPTVWDETRALRASIGDYVAVARRHGDSWYLGAMTNESSRTFELELSFLNPERIYRLTTWEDGPNADRYAEDYQSRRRTVSADDMLSIEMAPGGGFVGRFEVVSKE